MRQSTAGGNGGARRRAPEARDFGWDDSLYEDTGGAGTGGAGTGTAAATAGPGVPAARGGGGRP
ncbi:LytR family transcriptional regulator, partial [Streptomyces sp. B1866]|nr:LytR family transcriptional regulator [Streptomyces sp. B1866]